MTKRERSLIMARIKQLESRSSPAKSVYYGAQIKALKWVLKECM